MIASRIPQFVGRCIVKGLGYRPYPSTKSTMVHDVLCSQLPDRLPAMGFLPHARDRVRGRHVDEGQRWKSATPDGFGATAVEVAFTTRTVVGFVADSGHSSRSSNAWLALRMARIERMLG